MWIQESLHGRVRQTHRAKKKNTQFEKSGDDSTHVCAMKRLRAKSRSKVRGALAKVKPVKELLKSPKVTRT